MKICVSCNKNLPLSEFWKSSSNKDGYQSYCRDCIYKWKNNNKDKVKIYKHKYNLSDKRKKSNKKYYDNNKEKIADYWRTDKGKHISKMNKLNRLGVRHTFTYKEWMEKVKETNGICPNCGTNVGIYKLTLDHIIPISAVPIGTYYTINDVQPLCKSCNSSKNDKVMI
jgi:5-methylcytosine-specific restriction endonuclease McrA